MYLVADFRKISQRHLRLSEGFTPPEVEAMRKQFEIFDEDGDGKVVGHELRRLIEFVQPAAASDANVRHQVASILAEIDTRDEKSITFQGFLKLTRKMMYAQEMMKQEKEKEIANA